MANQQPESGKLARYLGAVGIPCRECGRHSIFDVFQGTDLEPVAIHRGPPEPCRKCPLSPPIEVLKAFVPGA